ncbi:hypothetical protein NPIL_369521 [Nephila pilipes]|uniref:Uncharacterized protein n=1 Tax=Nephila pilipes TaxID=299642 RepID=A0A8X6QZ97_NEPPI|nr:hypothetical protein NPIL_369521 [Nephila pilipes]
MTTVVKTHKVDYIDCKSSKSHEAFETKNVCKRQETRYFIPLDLLQRFNFRRHRNFPFQISPPELTQRDKRNGLSPEQQIGPSFPRTTIKIPLKTKRSNRLQVNIDMALLENGTG